MSFELKKDLFGYLTTEEGEEEKMPRWTEILLDAVKDEEKKTALTAALDGMDLQKVLDPVLDREVTKGVETNRKKLEADFSTKYDAYYEEKLATEYPELKPTKEMSMIKELRDKLAKAELKEHREAIKARIATAVKLPDFISLDTFIDETPEASVEKAKAFYETFTAYENSVKEAVRTETAKQYNVTPKAGSKTPDSTQASAMKQAESGDLNGAMKTLLGQDNRS